jgi:hypothetical protein
MRAVDSQKSPVAIAQLRTALASTRPVVLAEQRRLPLLQAFQEVFPEGGLQRGSIVHVSGTVGATAVALAIAAGPTQAGSWVACVGVDQMGWAAAAELGVQLQRVAVVQTPASSWATVTAALVDSFDLVLCGSQHAPSAQDARRLAARARERGSVVMLIGGETPGLPRSARPWPTLADVELCVVDAEWFGIGHGSGRLRQRRITLDVRGRRSMSRSQRLELWLPDISGGIVRAEQVRATTSTELTPSAGLIGARLRDAG